MYGNRCIYILSDANKLRAGSEGAAALIRIEIEPVWRFRRDADPKSILVMLDFLNEIRVTAEK